MTVGTLRIMNTLTRSCFTSLWLNGRASDYGSEGCRFESCQGCFFYFDDSSKLFRKKLLFVLSVL